MDSIKNYPEGETWKIGDKDMPVVEQTTHMGIPRSSSDQEMHAVETNIQKAQRTMYSLMGAGLHGENGLDPETAVSLLQTYVFPVLYYGMEIITPTGKALNRLEVQQKKNTEASFVPFNKRCRSGSLYNLGCTSRGSHDTQENSLPVWKYN